MNGRSAKLINRFAAKFQLHKRRVKRYFRSLSTERREEMRRHMLQGLEGKLNSLMREVVFLHLKAKGDPRVKG